MQIPSAAKAMLLPGLLLLTGSSWKLTSQEVYAQIRGLVRDPSGAAVVQAQAVATNTDTAISSVAHTAADGTFEFLKLPVGKYDIAISKAGFETYRERGINLQLNQVYKVSAALELAQVQQQVEVHADLAQVDSSTSQLGTVIDSAKIVDLPLNGRDWTQLQQLTPGTVAASDRNGTYATNGSQSQQNSYLIDGADSIDLQRNLPSIIPSPDAIGEFNMIDSTMNPEYGRNSGAILNAVLKSGTNEVHGSAFEFYRD
ncbi:MAG: carboxypeptidase regulatory-like domain-containing protein, partial [Acidobacteriaceae bacterium]|nr:carboxypeptidase regulatory-like domain-containing protein [Acidobacteriaceae bacterium]